MDFLPETDCSIPADIGIFSGYSHQVATRAFSNAAKPEAMLRRECFQTVGNIGIDRDDGPRTFRLC
ncbi:MAG: hypothetical protein RJB05_504 [Armatimonadota bacterium]